MVTFVRAAPYPEKKQYRKKKGYCQLMVLHMSKNCDETRSSKRFQPDWQIIDRYNNRPKLNM